ncbi:MAG TPA: proton-conducting transporter membrane subunit [Rhodopila sp.]|nr:proton-conducting transporter membrane subunit [Rhodopila sp.]
MSDPILPFLLMDAVALLLLGAFATAMPLAVVTIAAAMTSGLGALLCLPPLLLGAPATSFGIPIGPPGLSLHFALDPLSGFFLLIMFLAGTAIAAFQAVAVSPTQVLSARMTAFVVAGTAVSLLAADGVALTVGLAVVCAAIGYPAHRTRVLIPFVVLTALCLLTPPGYAPRFDAIRAAPIDPDRATATAALMVAAVGGLIWPHGVGRSWTRDALRAGVVVPIGSYLLLRVIADLPGASTQAWWGFVLLLAGGAATIIESWLSAVHPDIDRAISALTRRQAGLAMMGVGLALIARAADLPGAATFALQATCLTAMAGSLAGTVASLSAHTIGASAGTYRLSRLGGLVHAMPVTSAALSAGLFAGSALPPSLGFAAFWLSFQSILSAPRTGGLPSQVPLALAAAAIALSAALAIAASVRIVGIAILGRPRTPQGAGARESKSPVRTILLSLAGASLVAGILPSLLLWLLADPAIRILTGLPPDRQAGLALLAVSSSTPGYLALPVLALLALMTGAVFLLPRRSRKPAKIVGPWTDGMPPPIGLPFGDPAAQLTGAGFLPTLPVLAALRRPRLPSLPPLPRPRASAGIWLILAAFGALLLVLGVIG